LKRQQQQFSRPDLRITTDAHSKAAVLRRASRQPAARNLTLASDGYAYGITEQGESRVVALFTALRLHHRS